LFWSWAELLDRNPGVTLRLFGGILLTIKDFQPEGASAILDSVAHKLRVAQGILVKIKELQWEPC